MKALIVLLLLLPPARIDHVQMISSLTNEHGVVVIFLKSSNTNTQYTVSCNQDQGTCRFPTKDKIYELQESDNKLYKCHSVELQYGINEALGPYCLQSIE
jgi:hypothetical protein